MKKINVINIYFWFFQIKLIDRDEKNKYTKKVNHQSSIKIRKKI